jgi:hypothetical protein
MSPMAAYLAGIGSVAAAIGIGFTGGIMLTSTEFIQKDHAQVSREPRLPDKPADPGPVVATRTSSAATTANAPVASLPSQGEERTAPAQETTGQAADSTQNNTAQNETPLPPPLQDRRDAEPGMLLTPVRPLAQEPATAQPPLAQRVTESATGTIVRDNRKKAIEKKEASRKAQKRKQITETIKTAPATTGSGTREIESEDDEPEFEAPERPHGILDMLIGR